MSDTAYLILLLIANIPLFLVVGWLVFDTRSEAFDSFYEMLLSLIWLVLIGWTRWGRSHDGLISYVLFLVICAAILFAEHRVLTYFDLAPAKLTLAPLSQ